MSRPVAVVEPSGAAGVTGGTPGPVSTVLARPADAARGFPARAGQRDPASLPNSCAGCDARWSGTATAHCSVCHRTFSGVTSFDRHRRDGRCTDPAGLGMRPVAGRAYECWGFPEEATR
jgi:hypothetical protein